ncbi:MAG: cytochrome c biogenesis protein CcdA [Elusimicrobiaceae bacterium]|nr:cytochrome c biogenesis protein CcdA [Elusimicrobiaceae bacterium]
MQYIYAFLGGLTAFFSPCVLPLLPGYLSLVGGVSFEDLRHGDSTRETMMRTGFCSVFFTLGFSAVFVLMGGSATAAGQFLFRNSGVISAVSGWLLVLFGLHLTGLVNFKFLMYEKRLQLSRFKPGYAGAFFMGMAFAAGWSPCIGPILAGFLALAASSSTAWHGMALLACFSAGLALPFIAAGFASGRALALLAKYKKLVRYSCAAAGIFLMLIGLALIFRDRFLFLRGFIPVSSIF